jgi:hypothetical protein
MRIELKPITVRFTEEEKKKAEQNATAAGLSVSRFLAKTGSKGNQPITAEEKQFYIKILAQIKPAASNLNQLAAKANAGKPPLALEISETLKELRYLIKIIKDEIDAYPKKEIIS